MKIFNFQKLKKSVYFAFFGLKTVWQEEQSFRAQVLIASIVVLLMFAFPLIALERAILFLTIFFVLALELLNSQLERILDLIKIETDQRIKRIKDISASAVLLAAFGSLLIGTFIFLPYIF